jgi:hypothetical protein
VPVLPTLRSQSLKQFQIFPDSYWSSPRIDLKRQGDPSVIAIFCAVGAALSCWEGVEESLSTLYLVLTDCREANTANAVRRSFGSIENNSTRLSVIEAAAEVYFGHAWTKASIKRSFDAIGKAVKLASYIRNEIAHGKAAIGGATPETPDGHAFLFAPDYITGRQLPWIKEFKADEPLSHVTSRYMYTSADINLFSNKFQELRLKIADYIGSIKRNEHGVQVNVMTLLIEEAETREKKQKLRSP